MVTKRLLSGQLHYPTWVVNLPLDWNNSWIGCEAPDKKNFFLIASWLKTTVYNPFDGSPSNFMIETRIYTRLMYDQCDQSTNVPNACGITMNGYLSKKIGFLIKKTENIALG